MPMTWEQRQKLRQDQELVMLRALHDWVHMQSRENSSRLYAAALAYFGIKPVIPD